MLFISSKDNPHIKQLVKLQKSARFRRQKLAVQQASDCPGKALRCRIVCLRDCPQDCLPAAMSVVRHACSVYISTDWQATWQCARLARRAS